MTLCSLARRALETLKTAAKCLVAYLAVTGGGAGGIRRARAHGYLATPAARNVQHNSDYCMSCLNAGGPGVVYAHGLPGRHGVCGDPWNAPRHHEEGGKYARPPRVAGRYRAGGVLDARVVLTANHGGRWSLKLCPTPTRLTQRCFDRFLLRRADGKGPYTRVPGEASTFRVRYRLPKGLRCKRCVVQWHYETGNSCTPRGMRALVPGLPRCDRSTAGEQFWNCADIRIE
jgi:hypothetical protein